MNTLVRIAVVSDLHCHPFRNDSPSSFLTSDGLRRPSGKHPVESLAKLVQEENLRTNLVLCPGDITDQVNIQGLHSGWEYLKEIKELLGASDLLTTLGNHDVDSRHLHDPDPFQLAKGIRPREFPLGADSSRDTFWGRGFCLYETNHCHVLILNSVAGHFSNEQAKRGSLSMPLLEDLKRHLSECQLSVPKIAMVHHHPLPHEQLGLGTQDLMENGEILLEILEDFGFSLVIHGHKHHPRIRYSPASSSGPTVFAAGSFSAMSAQLLSSTRNLFHIIELYDEVPGCLFPGTIRSWEFNYTRGWTDPSPKSADFPATAGFGYRASPQELASRIGKFVGDCTDRVVPWEEVARVFPAGEFLLPRDLEKLGRQLKDDYSVELWPHPPDRPEQAIRMRR